MQKEIITTLDKDGHFDIPPAIRKRHGLNEGMQVRIHEQGNGVLIEAIDTPDTESLEATREKRTTKLQEAMKRLEERRLELAAKGSGNALDFLIAERRREQDR